MTFRSSRRACLHSTVYVSSSYHAPRRRNLVLHTGSVLTKLAFGVATLVDTDPAPLLFDRHVVFVFF